MASLLKISTSYCQRLARERARNFYYGFRLLPRPRREALCAIYAFMRHCDDVADGEGSVAEKGRQLREWREALERALEGDYSESLVFPAFHHAVERYAIPAEYFYDLIAGTEMDLSIRSYRTFADLYQYCYHVASVVGLCSLHVLGFRDPAAKKLAEECGVAFQLTNILRDIRQDAQNGRVYLPLEDLERYNCSVEQLAAGVYNEPFRSLMRFEIQRAQEFYERSYPLLAMVEPESRPALWTLIAIYRGILRRIERNAGNVFARPAALTDMEKFQVLLQAARMQLWHRVGLEPRWEPFRG